MGIMGPIGTVRQSRLPCVFSKGNVYTQLIGIKRQDGDKELLSAELIVKHGKKQVTESATLKWDHALEGFVATSSGVKTLYTELNTIKVHFSIKELNLQKTMTLDINKSISDENYLEEEKEVDEEVDIVDLNEKVIHLENKVNE